MMDAHGEQVSPIDLSSLPYAVNGGAGPRWMLGAAVALTAILSGVRAFTSIDIPLAIILAPPALLAVHVLHFYSLRNAVHLGVRMAQLDNRLDEKVINSINTITEGHLSNDRLRKIMAEASAHGGSVQ